VAADVACSKGDLPVVTVEVTLTAVTGLATAAEPAAVPTLLAAAIIGAAHDCNNKQPESRNKVSVGRTNVLSTTDETESLWTTRKIVDSSSPVTINDRLESTIW
jgi:hypothetical protein